MYIGRKDITRGRGEAEKKEEEMNNGLGCVRSVLWCVPLVIVFWIVVIGIILVVVR